MPITLHLPAALWHAVQALAPEEGDADTGILRALEEYVTTSAQRKGHRSGKYRKLVQALSLPVADLRLSARPASVLKMLKIRFVHELIQKSPSDLFRLPNFGEKSLREIEDKLATLELTLGMTVEEDAYRAAVVATIAASIRAAK